MQAELLCALQNQTTAPSYVLVDVDSPAGQGWRGAVESVAVAHAMALERGWPNARGHYDELLQAMRAAGALTLSPHTPEAEAVLRPLYTLEELEEARGRLARLSNREIWAELSDPTVADGIRRFYSESESRFFPRQAALAHALIERGFLPERGDYAPVLRVVESKCEEVSGPADPLQKSR